MQQHQGFDGQRTVAYKAIDERFVLAAVALPLLAGITMLAANAHLVALSITSLAVFGAWAGWLALGAFLAARRIAEAPKPESCPKRRSLRGNSNVRQVSIRFDAAKVLVARFDKLVAHAPVRVEDKIAFLRNLAHGCGGAALAMIGAGIFVVTQLAS